MLVSDDIRHANCSSALRLYGSVPCHLSRSDIMGPTNKHSKEDGPFCRPGYRIDVSRVAFATRRRWANVLYSSCGVAIYKSTRLDSLASLDFVCERLLVFFRLQESIGPLTTRKDDTADLVIWTA